jgi:hypothetical protein
LSKTVEKARRLTVLNLKTSAYKKRTTIETEKAVEQTFFKISFTIAENSVAKSGDKKLLCTSH